MRGQPGQRDVGAIAADQAGGLHPVQPLPAGGGRQVHPARQLGLGDAALARQDRQDREVAVIQREGSASEGGGRGHPGMFRRRRGLSTARLRIDL
jgi:hypothetical protein